VGTTEYMAPEVVRQMACGQAIDAWALGILLFEMMTGDAPWYHRDAKELQRKIVHTKLKLPPWLSNEARTLMRGLLIKDPAQRLGVKVGSEKHEVDWRAVKAHPFFRSLNWKLLLLCKLEPPYVPPLSDDEPLLDVSNFDAKYTGELACISPLRKPLSQGMEAEFERLQLEYTSPQTRDSIRESASSLCSDFSRRSSMRDSLTSNVSNVDGDADAPLLRFLSR
jgi:serine/threonine protein kinase